MQCVKNFIDKNKAKNLDIFAIAMGTKMGRKFCKFTGFHENLIVVSNNQIHNNLKISKD